VLLAQNSTGSLTSNAIFTAGGGNGGNGGARGVGGNAGSPGVGGAVAYDFLGDNTSSAGRGGAGGAGGNGGYGGGGGGGPSIGTLEDASSNFVRSGNQTTLFTAGAGGTSLGNPGAAGVIMEYRKL
jgi:hypothetical protein